VSTVSIFLYNWELPQVNCRRPNPETCPFERSLNSPRRYSMHLILKDSCQLDILWSLLCETTCSNYGSLLMLTHCTQASFDGTVTWCWGLNILQVIHFCPTASNDRVRWAFEWTAGCVPWNVRGGEHQPTNTRNRQTTLSEITPWYYDLDQPTLWTRWIFQYLTRKHKRIKFWQSCGHNDEPWQTDSNTRIAFIF